MRTSEGAASWRREHLLVTLSGIITHFVVGPMESSAIEVTL